MIRTTTDDPRHRALSVLVYGYAPYGLIHVPQRRYHPAKHHELKRTCDYKKGAVQYVILVNHANNSFSRVISPHPMISNGNPTTSHGHPTKSDGERIQLLPR